MATTPTLHHILVLQRDPGATGGDRDVPQGTFATPAFLEEESPQPPPAEQDPSVPVPCGWVPASGATLVPLLLQRHPSTLTTPEHTVELRGATLAWASKDKSSKKHVLEVRRVTAGGTSVTCRGPRVAREVVAMPAPTWFISPGVKGMCWGWWWWGHPLMSPGWEQRDVLHCRPPSLSCRHGDVTKRRPHSQRGFSTRALYGEEVSSHPGSLASGNSWGHQCNELGAVLSHNLAPKARCLQPNAGSPMALP